MKNNVKKRRKLNYQKIFSFISFIFVIICILWYGGRTIYFYKDSKKTITEEANTIARILKTQNHDNENFKQIKTNYYFYKKATNNYLLYSNILWRVLKINSDNSVVLVSDQTITSLAYGENISYQESPILKWLNSTPDDGSGILESKLNNKDTYLVKNTTCIDTIDDVEDVSCEKTNQDYYLGLLSIDDYINTGGSGSFINNERYTYLSTQNNEEQIWYINQEGRLDTTSGTDILGVKVVITLAPTLEIQSGIGTLEDPYTIEKENNLYGSYVKLDEDIWRIYDESDGVIKLLLNDYIKIDDEKLEYIYSNNNFYHNDTVYGSLAYYLNHTYLNSLSYKDLIIENKYANGYYGIDNQFDYKDALDTTIDTFVALPSIGDILWDDTLDGYFTSTGTSETSTLIYVGKKNGTVSIKSVTTEQNVIPCISIQKENLTLGSGSLDDPYRTE